MSAEAGEKKEGGHGGLRVVVAALAVNLAIAACKIVAAVVSRSTAMLAEALHSLADCANQVFLLVGMRLSTRAPDEKHPFGYGPETYFWSFIVALCIFAVGGSVSIVEGVQKILHRGEGELGSITMALVVLGASVLLEGYSFTVAMREFGEIRRGRGVRQTLREARDPTVLTVLFEDLAALFGLVVAATGLLLAHYTRNPVWDGAASVVVGLALVAVSGLLASDAKSVLIGEAMTRSETARIEEIAKAARDVVRVVHIRTVHFGPTEALAALKLTFNPSLDVRTLEIRINELEAELRAALPHLRRIYVEPGFDEHPHAAAPAPPAP